MQVLEVEGEIESSTCVAGVSNLHIDEPTLWLACPFQSRRLKEGICGAEAHGILTESGDDRQ